jgi:nicotinate phosphoribosyltransferase
VDELINELPDNFVGTSNIRLSRRYGRKPIGTQAHQLFQAYQVLAPLKNFQFHALNDWMLYYRGWLAVALTDTVGFDVFLKDFDYLLALAYTGCRHDSGDPFEWCEKLINHYKLLEIDPKEKTAVFSDGLTVDSAIEIYKYFKGAIKMSFGIGTSLTNDLGLKPLNIVIKMVECNNSPVAKLSDSPGKEMCKDEVYVAYLRQLFGK